MTQIDATIDTTTAQLERTFTALPKSFTRRDFARLTDQTLARVNVKIATGKIVTASTCPHAKILKSDNKEQITAMLAKLLDRSC